MKVLAALFAILAPIHAADWPIVGGDAQGSNWQKHGKQITTANVKDLKLLWKRQLDSVLSAPVIMGPTITHRGVRELVFVDDAHDNLYAIDADLGTLFWKRHFDVDAKSPCAAAVPSSPVIEPDPDEDDAEDDEPGDMRPLYAIASDGRLHTIRVSDGADIGAPIDFLPPYALYSNLNFWSGTVYAATHEGCNRTPDGLWSIDVTKPGAKPGFSRFAGHRVTISATGNASAAAPKAAATWQGPDGVRWSYDATGRDVRAFVNPQQELAWTSSEIAHPGPPVVSNGVVFLLSPAGLTALDAASGKQLYSGGPSVRASVPDLAVANGHICFVAENTLYCFGIPMER